MHLHLSSCRFPVVSLGSFWFLLVLYGFFWFLLVPFGSFWFLLERRGGPKRNARGCPRWVHFGSASIGHAPTHPDNWGARFGIDGSTADGAPVYFAPYTVGCPFISTRTATGGTTQSMVEHEPHESLATAGGTDNSCSGHGLPRGRGFDFCANGRYVRNVRWHRSRILGLRGTSLASGSQTGAQVGWRYEELAIRGIMGGT